VCTPVARLNGSAQQYSEPFDDREPKPRTAGLRPLSRAPCRIAFSTRLNSAWCSSVASALSSGNPGVTSPSSHTPSAIGSARLSTVETTSATSSGSTFGFTSWRARQKQQRHARIVIRAMTQFMWLTGVRTAEAVRLTAKSIRYIPVRHGPDGAAKEIPLYSRFDYRIDGSWTDRSAHEQTTLDAEYVVIVPPVKHRSHGREAIPREEFLYWVTSHGQYLSSVFGGKPHNYFNVFDTLSEDLPLFPCLDGRVLADLGKHHDRLLDDALSKQFDEGLLHIDGKRMSLSSWRHTYVTEMLSILAKKKTPNLVSFLAKNIGPSER